jgi:hypothetical protein
MLPKHGGDKQRALLASCTSQSVVRAVFVVVFVCVYLFPFVRTLQRVGDEGTIVYGAQRVAQGAVPYRDFVEVMGPASFYWLALFFKLFGISWWVARAHLMLTGILISLLVYWLTRRLYRGPESLLPFLFVTILGIPLWPGSSHHWDSNLFALVAAAAYFKWLETKRTWYLWTAGLATGITTCFMQQKGLLVFCAIAVLILINRDPNRSAPEKRKSLCFITCGYLAVGAITVLWFHRLGAVPDLIRCTVIMPLTTYSNLNIVPYAQTALSVGWKSCAAILSSLPGLTPAFFLIASVIPVLMIAAVPLFAHVLAAACVIAGRIRTKCLNSAGLPYYAIGSALCLSEIHRKDFFHLSYGAPLLLILMIYTAKNLLPARHLRVCVFGIICACLLLFGSAQWLSVRSAQSRIPTRRGTVIASADDAVLRFLDRMIPQGEYVFVYPYYPMYYFLADLRNPTRFSILLYNYNTDSQFDEVIDNLDRKRVKYILWDTVVEGKNLTTWFPAYQHPGKERLKLEQFFQSHYEQTAVLNGFRILQRKE